MAEYQEHDNFDLVFTGEGGAYQARLLGAEAGDDVSAVFARPRAAREEAADQVGGRLFQAAFAGPVGERFRAARAAARERGAGLRVRLRFAGCQEIAALPWQLLYDTREGAFLGLSGDTAVSRHLEVPGFRARPAGAPPLRILSVVTPRSIRLAQYLVDLRIAGLVSVTELDRPAPGELVNVLAHETFDLLDYAGLGAGDDGLSVIVRGHGSIRAVVLTAGPQAGEEPAAVLVAAANAVLRGGASGVVTRYSAGRDFAGTEFGPAFYGALAEGRSLAAAVAAARAAIYQVSPVDWGNLALHLAADDLLAFAAGPAPAPVAVAAVHLGRAGEFRRAGRYADAEASYAVALTLDPGSAGAHEGLADVLHELRRYAEAEAACRTAIRLAPADDPAQESRRRLLDEILLALARERYPGGDELQLVGVRVEMPSNNPLVILKSGQRYLVVYMSPVEAAAIAFLQNGGAEIDIKISGLPSYILLRDILDCAGARVLSTQISASADNGYAGEVLLSNGARIASQPSEAIILSELDRAPVYAAAGVMDTAGISLPDRPEPPPAGSVAIPEIEAPAVPSTREPAMIEMELAGVRVEVPGDKPIVLLKEQGGDRYLPIWISAVEATSIAHAQQGGELLAHPRTDELTLAVLATLDLRVTRATIDALVDDTVFEAGLTLSNGRKVRARASDAILLAYVTRAPLLAAPSVLDAAGVAIPDQADPA